MELMWEPNAEAALQDQVQEAFATCRHVVDEELGRYQLGETPSPPAVSRKDELATTTCARNDWS